MGVVSETPDPSQTNPISLSPQGPPTTVLPEAGADERHMVDHARSAAVEVRKSLAAAAAARFPRSMDAWALLGERLHPLALAGLALSAFGVYVVSYQTR